MLIVRHSTLCGKPEYMAVCLAGACQIPADRTLPMITSSTSFTSKSNRSNKPAITAAPSCGAENSDRAPPNAPIGVRPD